MKVAIVGAGIAGLTAALALLRRNIDVDVYEQAAELREVGAGVQISPNGTKVLNSLGLRDALATISCEPDGKVVRLWSTGQSWKLFDLGAVSVERYGAIYLTLHRADLHTVLANAVRALKADAIHLNARCVGLEQAAAGVSIMLADGGQARAEVVIGADGIHSAVRAALFGAGEPEFTGIMAWRAVMPSHQLPAHIVRSVGTNWIGPGHHVVTYPLRGGDLFNFVGAVERSDWTVESWSVRGSRDECASNFRGWHPDIHAMIATFDQPYKWALMRRAPLRKWSRGRVALMGDACHPMLPFMAQGAVMAIEDAIILARVLERHGADHDTAFRRYEELRVDRAVRAVEGSAANTERFHNPQLADPRYAADYVSAQFAEARVKERFDPFYSYDASTVAI
jgi:salicylate hydroxylase